MASILLSKVKLLVQRIVFGQVLSFLMSLTGLWTTLLVNDSVSYSIFQSLTSYLFIFSIYFPAFILVKNKYKNQKFSNFVFLSRWWKYAILGLIDLEANYVVVSAYQYTDITSVQLLNCFTLPCVLVLSYFILRMKFALTHIFGCVIAIGGLILLILLDADNLSRTSSAPNPVIGDLLCVLGSFLYALNNVLTEWFIKTSQRHSTVSSELASPNHSCELNELEENNISSKMDKKQYHEQPSVRLEAVESRPVPLYIPVIEYLALMSFFALVFSAVQFFTIEWKTFHSERSKWKGKDCVYQVMFGVTMLLVYTVMPSLFIFTSAAFANISLSTAVIYAVIHNSLVFHIYPTIFFFISYFIIFIGILLYNITDIFQIAFLKRWNYPCGDLPILQGKDK